MVLFFSFWRGVEYFLMIGNDMKEFCDVKKNGSRWYPTELLDSWTEHAKINPKRSAIRGFTDKDIGLVHVLTDDVLKSIPILMETQKKEPESYAEKLADLEKKWRVEDPNSQKSQDFNQEMGEKSSFMHI
ncbi:hypothetical protein CAEBREN_13010 [Caenorhabditis brenneri]|uniref:Uncharacterized protein n=1 Tax=Caenorhabditis brenneri TaxID=135651 RepID=G0NY92_CAEBE|nr:hypothetical protein CAEBREN_13010 [Caenorhabditis brenneri]